MKKKHKTTYIQGQDEMNVCCGNVTDVSKSMNVIKEKTQRNEGKMEDDNKHTEVRRMKRLLRCTGRKNPPSFLQTSALYIDVVAAWHILPRSEGEVTVA